MNKELKIDGIFYMSMLPDESEIQALERFWKLTMEAGIIANEGCCSFEIQEI